MEMDRSRKCYAPVSLRTVRIVPAVGAGRNNTEAPAQRVDAPGANNVGVGALVLP